MKIGRVLHTVFSVALCVWVVAQFLAQEVKVPTSTEQEIPQRIINTWKELREKNMISGSILIKQGDKTLFADGSQDQTYAISSMSKSFVGLKYAALENKGLDLNTPACKWLPSFCVTELNKVTLRLLLDHKAGFGRDLSFGYFLKRTFDSTWTIQDIDHVNLTAKDLMNPPGVKYLYSNFGYLTLSRILELIEQKSFSEIMGELQKDAHLTQTSVIAKGEILPIQVLVPGTHAQTTLNLETILYRSAGTGGIKSSAQDMAQWLEYAKSLGLQKIFAKNKDHYRQGWVRSQKQSFEAYWHNGASLGAYSLMAVIPKSDLKIVVLTNNFKFAKQWAEQAEQFEQYFY